MKPFSAEYVKGSNAAKLMAEGCVQEARRGGADNDLRSIIANIHSLEPTEETPLL
jgi:hypothetical protein